jgi:UDP-3-O-[3-hydroxymyristoyl] glucosamine N-acyltransferase
MQASPSCDYTAENFKFMKVDNTGISVSDDLNASVFTQVVLVSKAKLMFNKLFTLFIGEVSMEQYVKKAVKDALADIFDVDEKNEKIIFKQKVVMNTDVDIQGHLLVDGQVTVNDATYLGSNLSVSGHGTFEGDIVSAGSIAGAKSEGHTG